MSAVRAFVVVGVLLLLIGVPQSSHAAEPTAAIPAPSDTLKKGDLLKRLQEEDARFFNLDVLKMNAALRDSAKARMDSLGLAQGQEKAKQAKPLLGFEAGAADELITYNRVDGLVAGASVAFTSPRLGGASAELQLAYATGPERLRWYGAVQAPLSVGKGSLTPRVGYAERSNSYGSSHIVANGLRMFLLSVDDQDYLFSEGTFADLTYRSAGTLQVQIRGEAADHTSMLATTDFGIFNSSQDLDYNAPIDDGRDQSITGMFWIGHLRKTRQTLGFSHRVSGGELGGDFSYTRFAGYAGARRFVLGHELTVESGVVVTGGDTPVQQLADLGSLTTLRGFPRRALVGETSTRARAELLLSWDFFRLAHIPLLKNQHLQFVPFGDAGRVWEGNSELWLTSAGVGVQKFLGPFGEGAYLRLDAAFPIGPERVDDVTLYLYFARGLF